MELNRVNKESFNVLDGDNYLQFPTVKFESGF